MSRAVDETGYVQPTRAELLKLRGPGTTGYHLNPITGWVVQADGRVVYKEGVGMNRPENEGRAWRIVLSAAAVAGLAVVTSAAGVVGQQSRPTRTHNLRHRAAGHADRDCGDRHRRRT